MRKWAHLDDGRLEPTGEVDVTEAMPAGASGSSACAACGAGNVGDGAFCTQCGAPRVTASFPPVMATPVPPPPMPNPATGLATPPTVVVNLGDGAEPIDAPQTIPVSLGGALPPVGPTGKEAQTPHEATPVEVADPPTIPYRPPVAENVFVSVAPFPIPPPPPPPAPLAREPVVYRLTDHQGNALADDIDLFAPAPPEIGTPRSAATSLLRGRDSGLRRLARALPLALALAALAWLGVDPVMARFAPPHDAPLAMLRWAPPALVLLVVLWAMLPSRRVLSYVGVDGVALCDVRFRFWPPARPPLAVLAFARARDLTVDVDHRQGHLSFRYTWHGQDGSVLLRVARRCRATDDGLRPLRPGHARLYDFCRAAERSWTLRMVEGAKRVLAQPGGALLFPVYASNCTALRLQDGELVFALASGEAHIPASLLSSVCIVDGKVHFSTEEGDISLPCAQVGNLGALLLVLTHHLGVTVR